MATLGAYDLLDELGRGGMGVVYRARHRPTGAVRAVKVLTGSPDPQALERFRREAEALARAGGEGIVAIHEAGVERGRLFFAMALMTGGSLRERLRAAGRLPPDEACRLVAALARTLERCHAAGLVHRDLKPDNVLFDEEGKATLVDFGCVRDLHAASLTESGTVLGTPAYMAPEQLNALRVDAGADVYALGVLLHELVAGALPFEGASAWKQLETKLSADRRSLVESGAPAALEAIVARALAPDPQGRTRSAAALARDLEELGRRGNLAAGGPAWPLSRGATLLAAGAALSALALTAALTFPVPPPAPGERPRGLAAGDSHAAQVASSAPRLPAVTPERRRVSPEPTAFDRITLLLKTNGAEEALREANALRARERSLDPAGVAHVASAAIEAADSVMEKTTFRFDWAENLVLARRVCVPLRAALALGAKVQAPNRLVEHLVPLKTLAERVPLEERLGLLLLATRVSPGDFAPQLAKTALASQAELSIPTDTLVECADEAVRLDQHSVEALSARGRLLRSLRSSRPDWSPSADRLAEARANLERALQSMQGHRDLLWWWTRDELIYALWEDGEQSRARFLALEDASSEAALTSTAPELIYWRARELVYVGLLGDARILLGGAAAPAPPSEAPGLHALFQRVRELEDAPPVEQERLRAALVEVLTRAADEALARRSNAAGR